MEGVKHLTGSLLSGVAAWKSFPCASSSSCRNQLLRLSRIRLASASLQQRQQPVEVRARGTLSSKPQFRKPFCSSSISATALAAEAPKVQERDEMSYDVVVVGAGPAGLSCAIRLKQKSPDLSVCVVDKSAEVGLHTLSGNVFEPSALKELFPDWRHRQAPVATPVSSEEFLFLTETRSLQFPNIALPPQTHNQGNYIISLGAFCKWLAAQAEELGVEIYAGFSARSFVFDEHNNAHVKGIQVADVGVSKTGDRKTTYQPGMQLLGRQVVLAEGCHGSLSEDAMDRFRLRESPLLSDSQTKCSPQQYGLGLKEVWEVLPENHSPGRVTHSVGWPLTLRDYGGSFVYHAADNHVYLGFVVGLDYKNPFLSPYEEFQRFKHHPFVRKLLDGGRCIAYGARCLNEGGIQSIPKLSFKGGMLIGCSAGFLNVPKIKGTHTAMKSGIVAADCISAVLTSTPNTVEYGREIHEVNDAVKKSWIWSELHQVRNCKPAFKLGGLLGGLVYTGMSLHLFRGLEPWTFRWNVTDTECTEPAAKHKRINYPTRVKNLSFDLLDNLARSGTNHEHDQPSHLQVKKGLESVPVQWSWKIMGAPESRFCPAGVYEYVQDDQKDLSGIPSSNQEDGGMKLQINAQNCLHCKCCSIKTPKQFIRWVVPEGGGGPTYENM